MAEARRRDSSFLSSFLFINKKLTIVMVLAGMLAGVGFYLWRCQFGVDTYDEAYYLAPGFNLMPRGDLPFRNEINNAPRHFDLLNRYLIQPWAPYRVLALRRLAVLAYAAILFAFLFTCFRGNLGVTALAVFLACLLFDFHQMPTWSHNWWYRNLLLLHHTGLALTFENVATRKKGTAIAGFLFGVLVVAYTTQIVVLALLILVWGLSQWDTGKIYSRILPLRTYILGALVPLIIDGSYIVYHHLSLFWWSAFRLVLLIPDYSGNSTLGKMLHIIFYVVQSKDFCVLSVVGALAFFGLPRTRRFRPVLPLTILSLLIIYFIRRTVIATDLNLLVKSFIGWEGASALFVVGLAIRQRKPALLFCAMISVTTAMVVALSSNIGAVSLFWAGPALIIPGAALLNQHLSDNKTFSARILQIVPLLFFATMAYGAFYTQRTLCYRDVPPKECTRLITAPPYQGIRTNPERAALIDLLYLNLKNRKVVLAYPNLPGVFLFPGLIPATDSTLVNFDFPLQFDTSSLEKMIFYHRYPEVVVRVKSEPWTWGLPPTNWLAFPTDRPLRQFAECVRGKSLIQVPEFEIYEVTQQLSEPCALRVLNRQKIGSGRA
jgi:hypothetical protein